MNGLEQPILLSFFKSQTIKRKKKNLPCYMDILLLHCLPSRIHYVCKLRLCSQEYKPKFLNHIVKYMCLGNLDTLESPDLCDKTKWIKSTYLAKSPKYCTNDAIFMGFELFNLLNLCNIGQETNWILLI